MPSPAAAHRERILAKQRTESTATDAAEATEYELKLLQLAQDKRDLSNIKAQEAKIAKKVELFPNYQAWVQGVIDGNSGLQDDVLATMLVWAIDIGNYEWVTKIAEYAIRHKLAMPDHFRRDIPNIVAEEIADVQIKFSTAGKEMSVDLIKKAFELTKDSDLFDPVRAKLHKALGYALRTSDNKAIKKMALDELKRALELSDKSGVKKDIEHLEREIKNLSDPS